MLFFFQAEDGIRDKLVTGVQTCALPIYALPRGAGTRVVIASHADLRARLAALARIVGAPSSVVSVYLRTRWADEQQRERVRVFLNAELKKARLASASPQLAADLAWVAEQGERIIGQARHSDARGIALFAC